MSPLQIQVHATKVTKKFAWERATLFNTGGISARSAKAWTFLSLWEIDRSVPQGCSPGLEGTAAEAQ